MAKDRTQKRWYSDPSILMKKVAPKQCMAGFDCKPTARNHSISERRVLRKLAEDGKVIAVVLGETPAYATLGLQGVSQVSTFSGFCASHDQQLFSPIDNFDYEFGNAEQEFLFAYRTIARYHYYKLAWRYAQEGQLAALKEARDANKELYSVELGRTLTDDELGRSIAFYTDATKDAIAVSVAQRDLMGFLNSAIARKDYGVVATRVVEFPDEYPLAQSVSLVVDGASREGHPHMITVNVTPQNGRTYAILSCTAGYGTLCIDGHLERFRANGKIDYRAAITHIMCMAGDPIAIKPSYWESLPENLRSSFVERMNVWTHDGVDPVQADGSFNILQDSLLQPLE